jgi:hypothetical protein
MSGRHSCIVVLEGVIIIKDLHTSIFLIFNNVLVFVDQIYVFINQLLADFGNKCRVFGS